MVKAPAPSNGGSWAKNNAVSLIGLGLTFGALFFGGVFTMRDKITSLTSDYQHLREDVQRIERTMDRRSHDVAELLHQPGDEREADRLITLFNDPDPHRITDPELAKLASIMQRLGDDHSEPDGTRSLAKELLRLIELRLEPLDMNLDGVKKEVEKVVDEEVDKKTTIKPVVPVAPPAPPEKAPEPAEEKKP